MLTFTEVLARADVKVPDDEFADLIVPVLTGPQRQGDILILPHGWDEGGDVIPPAGVPVVRGEATGNTHILHADGTCRWTARAAGGVVLGHLHITEGSTAYLIHTDEHGANAIGPGNYVLHGKREQADEIRRVQD